jgi:hypothetical protein
MSTMSDWMSAVATGLGLEEAAASDATMQLVLDVTAEVAHGVTRPAAPVTAFLIGLAAGREADPLAAAGRYAAEIATLARDWSARTAPDQA